MKHTHISSLSRDDRESIRLEAGKLFAKGIPQADIARRCKASPAAVSYWHTAWKRRGRKGLKSKGHPGFASQLTKEKRHQFKQAIFKGPLAYGYQTNLWTLPRLATVMKQVTHIRFSEVWTWHIVRELGFTPQKPQVKARERDEQAITRWKAKTLPALKKMGWETRISSSL